MTMRFREDRLRELLRAKQPPWTLGQLHVQARRFRPTLAWRTLSEVANGKRQPTIEVVSALAAALDVEAGYLLDLPDEAAGEQLEGITAPWPARVTELAARLGGAPEDALDPLLDVFEGILVLMGLDGAGAPAATAAAEEYEDDEEARRLIWLLDHLPEERRLYWQAVIAAEAESLDRTDPGAAQTG